MAKYANGLDAREGDLVYGRPEDQSEPVFGIVVGIDENSHGHSNCLVVYPTLFAAASLEGEQCSHRTVPVVYFKGARGTPAIGLSVASSPAHTAHLTPMKPVKTPIKVNGREIFVGHSVTGRELKALVGADPDVRVFRDQDAGPNPPEIGHGQRVEVVPGMSFSTDPAM